MDSRSFTFGLVCGVVVSALAVWMIGRSSQEALPGTDKEPDLANITEAVTVAPPAERESQDLRGGSDPEGIELRPSVGTNVDPKVPWPDSERAKIQSEPKDDSWAYYMEQTLLQYLSAHPSIDQFDISYIECRTSMCQIEVFGFDGSTAPVWTQVMYDINQQPWSDFEQYGSGSGNIDGRLAIVSTLHRKPGSF